VHRLASVGKFHGMSVGFGDLHDVDSFTSKKPAISVPTLISKVFQYIWAFVHHNKTIASKFRSFWNPPSFKPISSLIFNNDVEIDQDIIGRVMNLSNHMVDAPNTNNHKELMNPLPPLGSGRNATKYADGARTL
jgi:hypothetical protein